MDIKEAFAIREAESLIRYPSKKSFSQVFQGMIKEGKKNQQRTLFGCSKTLGREMKIKLWINSLRNENFNFIIQMIVLFCPKNNILLCFWNK